MEEQDALARLVAAHPAVFRGITPGQFLPAGWYELVHNLVTDIEALLGDEVSALTVHQVKSKFASLRFYCALDALEPPGEPLPAKVTPHAGGFTVAARSRHPKRQAIDEAIALAGLASEKTCETCGATGEQLVDGAYVYVACPKHRRRGSITAAKYLARKRRRGAE